jgi:hypothetical protein
MFNILIIAVKKSWVNDKYYLLQTAGGLVLAKAKWFAFFVLEI